MLSNEAMTENTDKHGIPQLLTLKEASEFLKCHPNTLRQWDKKGILKAVRFGVRRDRRYKREDVLRMLSER